MPDKTIQEGLTFNGIAERLSVTKILILPLTRGWSVRFEASTTDPNGVWVDFYYNGSIGRDEKCSMSIRCNIDTIDNLFEMAKIKASTDLENDKTKYKGCYGVAVYRTLCLLRDAEVHNK